MRRARSSVGQVELSFFDVPAAPQPVPGSHDISAAVRECLAEVLALARAGGTDRYAVAAEVSRLSGRDMTKNMLDRYTAADEDKRFPLEALPALVGATGNFRLLELVAEACGCKVLRSEEAWITEVGAATLLERSVRSRIGALQRAVPDTVLERLLSEVLKRIGGER
ncbi:MAG: hypothetical protein IT518_14560 [Burkholderiales bacterium]|nr:hypothetical protein [Burkholderiales bacterium]